jgi:hypothetical protein
MGIRSGKQSRTTDAEYQRFAEQFADMILDPKRPWLIRYLLVRGFEIVPTWEELESDEFALSILNKLQEESWLWEAWFYDALRAGDRGKLVPYFKTLAIDGGLTKEHFQRLQAIGKSSVIRQSLNKLGKRFSFHRGPKPKLPVSKYREVYEVAETLRPAIETFIELTQNTGRTPSEILKFLEKDHPHACSFLLKRIRTFQQALADPGLVKRAKKRIPARARVLADAIAGTDHKLTFKTSIERVRQARRLSTETSLSRIR